MKISLNLLKRFAKRFGVGPLSMAHPDIQKVLAKPDFFIKAPAGFEPLITGGGYQWNDDLNGYTLGNNQKIFLLLNGMAIWIFKDTLFRLLNPDSIQKWVSADEEYPMGKANAFFTLYGKLTGQDLGQGETAGDEVPDGEQDMGGGGVAEEDPEGPPFSKQDVQNMLKGDFSALGGGPKASMQTAIPGEEPSSEEPSGTGLEDEPSAPVKGPSPDRTKVGNPPPSGGEAERIIKTLYKVAKVNPSAKLSKQNPIRLPSDDIIDLYQKAKTLPPEEGEKLIAFLKSGAVLPLMEGHILKSQLQTLIEHIVGGIVGEVDNAKKKAKEKKKQEPKEKPAPTQMDWEPENPHDPEDDWSGNKMPVGGEQPDYGKWVVAIANKLWKDKMDIGQGRPSWQLMKVVKHPTGDYYFLGKEKTVHLRRAFKRANNKWYYLDPDAKHRIAGQTWIELGKEHPSDEPSIEETGTPAVGGGAAKAAPKNQSASATVRETEDPWDTSQFHKPTKKFPWKKIGPTAAQQRAADAKKAVSRQDTGPDLCPQCGGKPAETGETNRCPAGHLWVPKFGKTGKRTEEGQLEEMTTTSGGGGSSVGTTGYSIPGAFAGNNLEKNKKHIEVLGYRLTPDGKKEMNRKADKLFEAIRKSVKKMMKEASGLGPDFDRAQRAYDNRMPPESDDLECPQCGGENGYYTEKGRRSGAFWWSAACPDCGHTWGDDNFDSLSDR